MAEVEAFVQEQSALVDKNTVYNICKRATEDKPYSFLFVKLRESDVNKIFMIRFERTIHIDKSQMVKKYFFIILFNQNKLKLHKSPFGMV